MRLMKRNLKSIWYRLYLGKEPVMDEEGMETGEPVISYGELTHLDANVSPAVGIAQQEMFGTLENYDKVVMTDDLSCPIDENTVMFIDREPEFDENGVLINSHDYIVRRVAKPLNSIAYAVSKVKVSDE